MENSIWVALIGAGATVAAPLVGIAAQMLYERRNYTTAPGERATSVNGVWSGRIVQPNFDQRVEIELRAKFRVIKGKLRIFGSPGSRLTHVEANLSGGFYYGSYLKLDYKNIDPNIMQFGSITLELDQESRVMEGKYSGYGAFARKIVSGDIALTRIK